MSAFDAVLSRVWTDARQDEGALLKEFTALRSDRERAARVLDMRLPELEGDLSLLPGKDSARAAAAVRRAAETPGRMEAVLALSEALRYASATDAALVRTALEMRAEALVDLQEPASSLRDLQSLQGSLPAQDPEAQLKIAITTCRCLELLGDWAGAETTLREAMQVVRDSASMDVPAKSRHVGQLMDGLRRVTEKIKQGAQGPSLNPRAQSGLERLPKLLDGQHPRIPCAAAAVEMRTDRHKGRHLVAARDIPTGSVLVVEPAYAWSLGAAHLSTHCLHCCAPTLAPLPCPACSHAVFCSESCLGAAMTGYHLVECGLLPELTRGGELSAMALLVFRIVVRAAGVSAQLAAAPGPPIKLNQGFVHLHSEQGDDKVPPPPGPPGYAAVLGQVTHSDSRPAADLLKRALTAAFLTGCMRASVRRRGLDITPEDHLTLTTACLRHLQACSCNAYQVSEQRLPGGSVREVQATEIGGACYPTVSLINHACCPNVMRHSHGNVCVVRAGRRIPKGGELLDCYGPHYLEMDREDRQEELAKQYFFQCECRACQEDWSPAPGTAALRCLGCGNRLEGDLASIKRCPKCKKKRCVPDVSKELASFEAGVQTLLRNGVKEALKAALDYLACLERTHVQSMPPCRDQARATQVLALCWSLAGNTLHS